MTGQLLSYAATKRARQAQDQLIIFRVKYIHGITHVSYFEEHLLYDSGTSCPL